MSDEPAAGADRATVADSGAVAFGGDVTITGGVAAGRDVIIDRLTVLVDDGAPSATPRPVPPAPAMCAPTPGSPPSPSVKRRSSSAAIVSPSSSPLTAFGYTAGGTNLETVQIRARSAAPFAAAIMLTPIGGSCEVPDSFVLATGKADTTVSFQVHVLAPDSGGASCTLKPAANSTWITTTGGDSRTYTIVPATTAT